MTKVFNNNLANTEVVFSFGLVQFDADGIADITPDENADLIIGVGAFRIVDEKLLKSIEDSKNKVQKILEPAKVDEEKAKANALSTEPIAPDFVKQAEEKAKAELMAKAEALTDSSKVAEIDAVAKSLNFEYSEGVNTKAEKLKAIKEFTSKQ